jgi:acyl-coenzyme A synthetase/AMP-(fatty) acid ligase
MTIDPVAQQARARPAAPAFVLPNSEVNFATFNRNINRLARSLAPTVAAGSTVAILIDNRYIHWMYALAIGRLGALSASVDPARHEIPLDIIKPDIVFSDRPLAGRFAGREIVVTTEGLRAVIETGDASPLGRSVGVDTPARYILSSGTTGLPKRTLFTHGLVLRRMRSFLGSPLQMPERLLCTMGLDTIGGYVTPLWAWMNGGALCNFAPDPGLIVSRGVTGILASPQQIQTLLGQLPADFRPPPRLSLYLGGARVPQSVSIRMRVKLSTDIVSGYGSTEVGIVAMTPFENLDNDPDLAGILVPGSEAEAIDSAGNPLPPGEVGELRVRSMEMVDGYVDNEEATRKHFRDGWFHPGDIGSISPTGEVRVLGRIDDVLNVGGVKVVPEVIEDVLLKVPGVKDVGVFTMEERGRIGFWAALVETSPVDRKTAQELVRQRISTGINFVTVDAIPRNSMGKIQRFELRGKAAIALKTQGAVAT